MEYKIGHEYIDKGGSSNEKDQFLRWINLDNSGMRNADGIRALNYVSRNSDYLPAYIILVSHEVKRVGNPWEDIVDFNSATIYYWGDAKLDERRRYNEFRGNKRMLQVWEKILEGNLQEVPPILHFSKPKRGVVKFNGLCILHDLQLTWYEQEGVPVKNYRFELKILDQDVVKINWLHNRATNSDLNLLNTNAPQVWKEYLKSNTRKMDIWSKNIQSKEEQLPESGSKDSEVLKELHDLNPIEFEAVVVELFKNLPHVSHKITRTRPTKDGGFDFYGQFVIPYPINYEIDFLGEAKKFSPESPVRPKDVSRLVARLGRGQFGIFVSTSYYTKQTQEEVLHDNYPVRLFSGKDLVRMLHELRLVDNNRINTSWLNSILDKLQE
jgi:restriction endonuclease Mrr